eukprot:3413872-Amphidinium_carterae.1
MQRGHPIEARGGKPSVFLFPTTARKGFPLHGDKEEQVRLWCTQGAFSFTPFAPPARTGSLSRGSWTACHVFMQSERFSLHQWKHVTAATVHDNIHVRTDAPMTHGTHEGRKYSLVATLAQQR